MADYGEVNSNDHMMGSATDYSAHTSDAAEGLSNAKQQKGAEAVAAKGQQDKEDRIVNNYQSLYQRSNASTMKAYQQSTKAP